MHSVPVPINVRCYSNSDIIVWRSELTPRTSRPEEFHLQGAPKTVREPLDSHGSRCSTVGKRAAGFTSSTGSSCCQLASVGRWSRLNNAAPSVQLHYRAFVPTTSHSAPVLRIGTLVLAVLAACDFSLYIGAQVLTFRTKAWLSFAPPPCRMPLGPSQASPKLIPKEWPPPGFGIA